MKSKMLSLLSNNLYHLLSSNELISPLFSHSLDLPTKLILFKPKYQLCDFLRINFLNHVNEYQLDDLTLIFYWFEYSVELLRQIFKNWRLFSKPFFVFVDQLRHFGDIQPKDFHYFEVNVLGRVGRGEALAKCWAVQKVFMDITD